MKNIKAILAAIVLSFAMVLTLVSCGDGRDVADENGTFSSSATSEPSLMDDANTALSEAGSALSDVMPDGNAGNTTDSATDTSAR